MQHINNDMDDLFRRAGEEYPLDTRGADWEKIARELNGAAHAEKTVPQKSDRRLLWLLVLLPFSLICNQYFGNNSKETAIKEDQPVTVPLVIEQNKERGSESNRAIDRLITHTGPGAATVKDQSPRQDRKGTTLQKEEYEERIKQQRPTGRAKNKTGLNEHIVEASAFVDDGQITASSKAYTQLDPTIRQYPAFSLTREPRHQNIVPPGSEKKAGLERRFKKWYAGLVVGIDGTSVKGQQVTEAGYDVGFLTGYSINKKWSIEAGLFMDKKFYYSDGKYLNTNKIYMPPNSEITYANGDCRMWEIPVSVRYNLSTSQKQGWFVTTGLSSYLMKEENYDYMYYYFSTGQSHERSRSYYNSSKHFLSVVQISGGYTRQLGKIDLRIEPYLKLPLKGVGVGSLPLQSGGIHVGITRRLF